MVTVQLLKSNCLPHMLHGSDEAVGLSAMNTHILENCINRAMYITLARSSASSRRLARTATTPFYQHQRLVVPPVRLSTVGSRAFAVAAPHIWNRLPTDVVAANSLSTFRRLLKRFLFRQSYPDIIY